MGLLSLLLRMLHAIVIGLNESGQTVARLPQMAQTVSVWGTWQIRAGTVSTAADRRESKQQIVQGALGKKQRVEQQFRQGEQGWEQKAEWQIRERKGIGVVFGEGQRLI